MQRADRAVAGKMAVELPRFGNGAGRGQRGPGPDDGFPLLDPSEAVADQILGSKIAGRDSNGGFGYAQAMRCQNRAPLANDNEWQEQLACQFHGVCRLGMAVADGSVKLTQRNVCMSALATRPAALSPSFLADD